MKNLKKRQKSAREKKKLPVKKLTKWPKMVFTGNFFFSRAIFFSRALFCLFIWFFTPNLIFFTGNFMFFYGFFTGKKSLSRAKIWYFFTGNFCFSQFSFLTGKFSGKKIHGQFIFFHGHFFQFFSRARFFFTGKILGFFTGKVLVFKGKKKTLLASTVGG